MSGTVRIHPDNPLILEHRGAPRLLLCATEHYGGVMNRPFDYRLYLDHAAEGGQTLTRLFVLFRELQSALNPYSTCKPESPDYVAPFLRTGPGTALDGQPRYDLSRPNPEFFERLHGFLGHASALGIVVELTLLSNTYGPDIWALNPLHPANNVNGTEAISWPEYMSTRRPGIWRWQREHIRRVVSEVNRYENLVLEVCNEPGAGAGGDRANPDRGEVNAWQSSIIALIREVESSLPNRHLVSGQEAFEYEPFRQHCDQSLGRGSAGLPFDVANVHPLPGTVYRDSIYDMGAFMSKQLRLRPYRDFCVATLGEKRPLNLDEDNVASQYKDAAGWTIHRKRAWTAAMCLRHYDYIDFTIIPGRETGTAQSREHIRAWMGHLSRTVHELDLGRARALTRRLRVQPPHTVEAVLGVEGEWYLVYLADERELAEPGAGEPIAGELGLDLPDGSYRVSTLSPTTGQESPAITVRASGGLTLGLPPFRHDIVARITRA